MKFSTSHWLSLAMIAALLATAVASHYFSPLVSPLSSPLRPLAGDAVGVVAPGCDLQQRPCTATLPRGQRLEFAVAPRPIPALQSLRVEATVTGAEPTKVEVDFAGESMNMGYNRSELAATARGRYAGTTSLPVCVSGGMNWVATVIVTTGQQRITTPFRFHTGQ